MNTKTLTASISTQPSPKFKVEDKVVFPPTLRGETNGIVTRVERIYKEIDNRTGKIDPKGLATFESTINDICIPYTFDGEKLTVEYPEQDLGEFIQKAHKTVSIFAGYVCVVKTATINIYINEKRLKLDM